MENYLLHQLAGGLIVPDFQKEKDSWLKKLDTEKVCGVGTVKGCPMMYFCIPNGEKATCQQCGQVRHGSTFTL
jgi:hypothetical protein